MNALQVAERSAVYALQEAVTPIAGEALELMANAPQGVAKLRELILSLAVRGKLVAQSASDIPASKLLEQISASRKAQPSACRTRRRDGRPHSADEEPFDIPSSWTWVGLADVTYEHGQQTPSALFTYIDVASVDNALGRIKSELPIVAASDAPSRARKLVKRGTVVYSTVRPYLKNIAIVEEAYDPAPIASTAFAILHPNDGLLSEYLYYYLRSPEFTSFVASRMIGVAYPAINDASFFEGVLPLPPLAGQHRIVARIDELMGLCDELEAHGRLQDERHARLVATLFDALVASTSPAELAENWQRVASHFDLLLDRPAAIDALEQTILQLAVRGLLVPQDPKNEPASTLLKGALGNCEAPFTSPRGWERVAFDTVVECLNGYAFKSEWFKPHGTRLVRNVNVSHGQLDWTDTACVNEQHTKEFERFALAEGDIVLTLDRPIISTGLKLAEIQSSDLPCLLLQRVAKLTPRNGAVTHAFLMIWLRSSAFLDALDPGRSNGVPHISTKQVGAIPFGLPPLAEQHRIVARVEELRGICAGLRKRLQQAKATQSHLADALVASAVA